MFSPFRFVWLRILFTFVLYSFVRLGFYLYHSTLFTDYTTAEILYSFIIGFRFDASAICLINSLFILICCLLPAFNRTSKSLKPLWVISNSIFLFLMIGDIEYYTFNNQHMQAHNFLIAKDIKNQGTSVILYYWPMFLVSISPFFS